MRVLQPRLNLKPQQTDRLTVQHSWSEYLFYTYELGVRTNDRFLDPTHVLASSRPGSNKPIRYEDLLKILPCYRSSLFTLRAFPNALLVHYFSAWRRIQRTKLNPSGKPVEHPSKSQNSAAKREETGSQLLGKKERTFNFPLFVSVSKKGTHEEAYIRMQTRKRIRGAIKLIICRGADRKHDPETGKDEIVFEEKYDPKDWVHKGAIFSMSTL